MPVIISQITTLNVVQASAAATTANPFFWYVTRAAAVSSYIVLSLVVLLGISRSLVRISGSRASWVLEEIHQFLALLVAALVGLHLLSLFLDPLIPFSLLNFALPIAEPYRPVAVDLGVLSLYGLVIVLASSWLRRYIKHTSWRALHYSSFAVFLLVTLHGVLAGSDSGQPWMIFVYLIASAAVVLMTIIRLLWVPGGAPSPVHPTTRSS
jgi:methionine sulfoxide reductase heme-binding subunit